MQALCDWSVTPRTRRWIETLHFLAGLMTNISQTFLYKLHSPFIQLLEVVRRMRDCSRFVTEPFHHLSYPNEKFLLFLFRICVIISQITYAIVCSSIPARFIFLIYYNIFGLQDQVIVSHTQN